MLLLQLLLPLQLLLQLLLQSVPYKYLKLLLGDNHP